MSAEYEWKSAILSHNRFDIYFVITIGEITLWMIKDTYSVYFYYVCFNSSLFFFWRILKLKHIFFQFKLLIDTLYLTNKMCYILFILINCLLQ